MNPSGQLITEALHTATLLIYIYKRDEPPWSINHKGLAYHYTIYIYIEREREEGDEPHGQLSIEALHTITLYKYIYIYIYIYILYRKEMNPPWSMDHKGLAYHYTIYIERERKEMNTLVNRA